MRNLIVTYRALLLNYGCYSVVKHNPKVAVQHIKEAILPESLRIRLQNYLSFGFKALKTDFKAFKAHY